MTSITRMSIPDALVALRDMHAQALAEMIHDMGIRGGMDSLLDLHAELKRQKSAAAAYLDVVRHIEIIADQPGDTGALRHALSDIDDDALMQLATKLDHVRPGGLAWSQALGEVRAWRTGHELVLKAVGSRPCEICGVATRCMGTEARCGEHGEEKAA